MSSRRSFTREFKVDAARQVIHGGKSVAQVVQELALTDSMLRRWIEQFKAQANPRDAFPGHVMGTCRLKKMNYGACAVITRSCARSVTF
jgi:transposase-like protein